MFAAGGERGLCFCGSGCYEDDSSGADGVACAIPGFYADGVKAWVRLVRWKDVVFSGIQVLLSMRMA